MRLPISCLNNTTSVQFLQDEKKPWQQKKLRSLQVAASYRRSGLTKWFLVSHCGSILEFQVDLQTGKKRLQSANFCTDRFCPMCQWRKSLKVFHEVSQVLDRTEQVHPDLTAIFGTFTMRNCSRVDLAAAVQDVLQGWYRLNKNRKLARIIPGWFRALELTYNPAADTFHPHLHAILLVPQAYFHGEDYMQTEEYVAHWQQALQVDYVPICDIRAIHAGSLSQKHKAVAEVAKYTLKDTDFVHDDAAFMDGLMEVLGNALYRRRLYAYGGAMKRLARELDCEDAEAGDLVDVGEAQIRSDVATVLEEYRWHVGLSNYVKLRSQVVDPGQINP